MNLKKSMAEASCATPVAMRYWTIVFIVALVPLIAIAVFWHPLSGAVVPFVAGVACVENWRRNRTYHCRFTGPIFFLAGAVLLLAGMSLIHVQPGSVWILAGVGLAVSFFLEWRYAG